MYDETLVCRVVGIEKRPAFQGYWFWSVTSPDDEDPLALTAGEIRPATDVEILKQRLQYGL